MGYLLRLYMPSLISICQSSVSVRESAGQWPCLTRAEDLARNKMNILQGLNVFDIDPIELTQPHVKSEGGGLIKLRPVALRYCRPLHRPSGHDFR